MTRFIFLPDTEHFPATSESPPAGAARDAVHPIRWIQRGPSATSGESLPADVPAADRTIAVIPISRIAFIDAVLPRVSAARRQQLLNFAIEDKLTIDPDTVHAIEVGPANTGPNHFVVAAIDRAWLTRALAWLTAVDLAPDLAVPESALSAVGQGEWLLDLNGTRGFAVRPDGLAYGVDGAGTSLSTPPFSLSLALNEAAASADSDALPKHLSIIAPAEIAALIDRERWSAELGGASNAGMTIAITPAANAAVTADESRLIASNFLVGRFKPDRQGGGTLVAFKWAAGLVCLAVLIHLTGAAADAWRAAAQRRALEGEMRALFLKSFPEATTVVDAPLQMARNLEQLRRERGLAQDPALAKLAIAASLTRDVAANISSVNLSGDKLTLTFDGLTTDGTSALRAAASKHQGATLAESAGRITLAIGGRDGSGDGSGAAP